jgi:hypothetical protein
MECALSKPSTLAHSGITNKMPGIYTKLHSQRAPQKCHPGDLLRYLLLFVGDASRITGMIHLLA